MPIRVALLGTQSMGRAHSHAFRTVASFFKLEAPPEMAVLCGTDPERTKAAAARFGWREWSTDWKEVVARKDIDLVDVATPGDTHAEISLAALAARKHVICEKPLANNAADAKKMWEAAKKAGTVNLCAFNYRRVPAIAHARAMIERGTSAGSTISARSTSRIGSSIPTFRSCGGCERSGRARAPTAISTPTSPISRAI